MGDPSAEIHASRLTSRFADLTGGQAIFQPAPGVVGSPAMREVIQDDVYVREVMGVIDQVTTALVGRESKPQVSGVPNAEPLHAVMPSRGAMATETRRSPRERGMAGIGEPP